MDPAQNISPFLLPEWVSVSRPGRFWMREGQNHRWGVRGWVVGRIQAEAKPGLI